MDGDRFAVSTSPAVMKQNVAVKIRHGEMRGKTLQVPVRFKVSQID